MRVGWDLQNKDIILSAVVLLMIEKWLESSKLLSLSISLFLFLFLLLLFLWICEERERERFMKERSELRQQLGPSPTLALSRDR